MEIQERMLKFISRANWVLLCLISMIGAGFCPPDFTWGIIWGGGLVTANFHLLARTLKKSLQPRHLSSHHSIIAKYYLRFMSSGLIIFILIAGHFVNPLGLISGLSVVVASIVLATIYECQKLLCKEAM